LTYSQVSIYDVVIKLVLGWLNPKFVSTCMNKASNEE
jgi:hypothetical protein